MTFPMKDFNNVHILAKCSDENARITSIQNAQELWLATQDLTDGICKHHSQSYK